MNDGGGPRQTTFRCGGRRPYESPRVVELGGVARGSGASCQIGSAPIGSCRDGYYPTGTCMVGEQR